MRPSLMRLIGSTAPSGSDKSSLRVMRLFGITGGIGMGKSTAGDLLSRRGAAVVDSDVIARQIVEPGQPALAEISAAFGPEMIKKDGGLDREKLAAAIFADPSSRSQLEAILHPKIRSVWQARAEEWRREGRDFGVVIIPLLFEAHSENIFDVVVCVACSARTQTRRLLGRGWSPEHIKQRLSAQWPAEEKIAKSDCVIWTDATLSAHAAQLERVFV
jgi:dephospho-CoA kinase